MVLFSPVYSTVKVSFIKKTLKKIRINFELKLIISKFLCFAKKVTYFLSAMDWIPRADGCN